VYSVDKYLAYYAGTPRGKNSSVHYSEKRFEKARKQASLNSIPKEIVMKHIDDFLELLEMNDTKCYEMDVQDIKDINYREIKSSNNLSDIRDIVWLKFTDDGYLGVVAVSNDINFDMPASKENYDERGKNGRWIHNTSGIIVRSLGKEWNKKFVLLIPLKNIPDNLCRGDIERGIGNYLIFQGVPILDFYSHNY